jgi:hypothetical protein
MWQKTTAALAVLVCGFTLTAGAYGPPLSDSRPVQEFEGTLDYLDGLGPRILEWDPWIGYGIRVGEKWYGLVLPERKDIQETAKKLVGKKAVVHGRVEQRTLGGLIPHQIDVIVVSDLHAAPVAGKIEPIRGWGGILRDESLQKHAPAGGFITDAAALAKLWEAWKVRGDLPKIDFTKELVLVAMSSGPNALGIDIHLDSKGNLATMVTQTLIGGPGFGYRIVVIKRDGVKTIGGQPLA